MSFQSLGSVAARVVANLEPRPLVNDNGSFNTRAIADLAHSMWADKQDFLSGFRGEQLEYWQTRIWSDIKTKVAREASSAQAQYIVDHITTEYTALEREQLADIDAKIDSLPIYEHSKRNALSVKSFSIRSDAYKRTIAAAFNGIGRDRKDALAEVDQPIAVAAE